MERIDARPAAMATSFDRHPDSLAISNAASSEKRASEFALSPPTISLPKGGGALRGIDEKFAVNPATGTGSISIPIATTPGRQGFGPDLALSYDSGFGNGSFGLGWRLSLPTIARKTDKGLPRYREGDEADVYILAGSDDLVPLLDSSGARAVPTRCRVYGSDYLLHRYRPRNEGAFAWIERWVSVDDPTDVFWRTISRDNVTTWFGRRSDSRVFDPADPRRIFEWSICERYDDRGNVVEYEYLRENADGVDWSQASEGSRSPRSLRANSHIKHVRYGNVKPFQPSLGAGGGSWPAATDDPQQSWMFELVFDYGDHSSAAPLPTPDGRWSLRGDPFSSYRAGFEVRTLRLARRALMFHHFQGEAGVDDDCLVASTHFDYVEPRRPQDPEERSYTVLESVQQFRYQRRTPPGTGYVSRDLPPIVLSYSAPLIDSTERTLPADSLENLPIGTQGPSYEWVDLDGEGLAGVLTEHDGTLYYKANLGAGRLAPTQIVARTPAMAELGAQRLLDLAGDGDLDLVDLRPPTPGFHERDPETGWTNFVPFRSLPNVDWSDANLRFVDVTGDGRADVLITEDEAIAWYPSLEEDGFGAAERTPTPADEKAGPRLVFADGTETVFLADMSGDGLADLVRIRPNDACFFPNLGYGTFGAKVTLANSPSFDHQELYDPRRVRLADIDGSGPADLIYLGRGGAQLYFNRSGNGFSDPVSIPFRVATDNVGAVQAADVLGDGTACLVWNSHLPADAADPVRFVSLMADGKPHLLTGIDNSLGGTTEIEYTPSTRFYIEDKLAGTPWRTRLPFPVHCVSKVTVKDKWRGTTFSCLYRFHGGVYDGFEREFRGFSCVEQIDVEDFGRFAQANADSPFVTQDKRLYQPPVKTVTWYDTGTTDGARAVEQAAGESILGRYTSTGFAEHPLASPDPPAELTDAEWREALRARKGRILRQETYELAVDGLDSPAPVHTPVRLYTATAQSCDVELVQPRGPNQHAVFLVTDREALTYEYDLALPQRGAAISPDPRVTHTLLLRHDELGNPEQTVTVAYGRFRPGLPDGLPTDLPHPDRIVRVQAEPHVVYLETRYTDDVVLRTPAVAGRSGTVKHHRLRLLCEQRTYELTGLTPLPSGYFDVDRLRRHALCEDSRYPPVVPPSQQPIAVARLAYQEHPTGVGPHARMIDRVRTLFRRDEDGVTQPSQAHPFGRHGPRGIKFEDYKFALTKGLLDAVFKVIDPTTGALDNKLAATLDNTVLPVSSLLDDPLVSGYVPGTALDPSFTQQYWIASGRVGFVRDARAHFYLPDEYQDPFGNKTTVTYDGRDLYVETVTDALANESKVADFDFRTVSPRELIDANGNHREVVFDIRGRVAAAAVKGKQAQGSWQGDNLDGFTLALANPDDRDVRAFCSAATLSEATARTWLDDATTRFVYHFGERRDPVTGAVTWGDRMAGACAITRDQHAGALSGSAVARLQVRLECSDGSSGVLMSKLQAEPEHAGGPDRWVVNGLTVVNNKGRPVIQYEAAFSDRFGCQRPSAEGVTAFAFYDASGRLMRTEFPDGTVTRAEFSPWFTSSYDQNDTVLTSAWYQSRDQLDPRNALMRNLAGLVVANPDQRAGWLAARHADTPALTLLDSLGRPVISVAHNRVEDPAGSRRYDGRQWKDEYTCTYTHLDAEGKPLWIRDENEKLVVQYVAPPKPATDPGDGVPSGSVPCYDIAGNLLFQHSMDSGSRWLLPDASGKPMLGWDANERQPDVGSPVFERRLLYTRYDALHRPVEQWLRVGAQPRALVEAFEYSDTAGLTAVQLAAAQTRNLIGQRVAHYDTSGLATLERVDVDGAIEETTRTLVDDAKSAVVDWHVTDRSSLLEQDGGGQLETFRQVIEHDALGRPTTIYDWHCDRPTQPGWSDRVAVLVPAYNARGLVASERMHVRAAKQTDANGVRTFVPDGAAARNPAAIAEVTWNARAQKLSLELGNGTVTRYTYDPSTFRLVRLETRRGGNLFQDLQYSYDAVGNITHIEDDAQDTQWFANQQVEPSCDYTYDALDRLTEATGREYAAAPDPAVHHPGIGRFGAIPSSDATRRYEQRYRYDGAGNIVRMTHVSSGGQWTRNYEIATDSNRLLRTWYGTSDWDSTPATRRTEYRYDTHGNMLNLATTEPGFDLRWDWRDMVRALDLIGGGWAFYTYGSEKQRARKRLERNGGAEERISLDGYERYRRWVGTTLVEEIESIHLSAGDERVLLVDDVLTAKPTAQPGPNGLTIAEQTLFRYQYGNQLGSVNAELDGTARVISYEEFHPYGTTAYCLQKSSIEAPAKRYRYTGMERDEESGLACHGARYLSPLLGRWISCDPSGIEAGLNQFEAFRSSPASHVDRTGKAPAAVPDAQRYAFDPDNQHDVDRLAELLGPLDAEGNEELVDFYKDQIAEEKYRANRNIAGRAWDRVSPYLGKARDAIVGVAGRALGWVSERESVKAVTETVGEVVEVQTKSFDRAVAEPFYDMSGAGRRTDPVGASIAAETYRKALEIPGPSIRHGAGAMLQAATLPSDIKMVAELTAAVITKTVSFADWSLTAIAFSASRSSYRRQVLKLAQKAGSDISFLINPTTKRYWGRPTGWDMSYLQSHPEIWEAAHVISDKSGQPGPLIVMSAYYNQLAAQTVEGRHGLELYVKLSEALEIGGVLVDPATARDWVKAGHITQAVFDQAKRVDLSGL